MFAWIHLQRKHLYHKREEEAKQLPVTTENTLHKIGNPVRDKLNILSLHAVVFKNKIPKVTFVLLKT